MLQLIELLPVLLGRAEEEVLPEHPRVGKSVCKLEVRLQFPRIRRGGEPRSARSHSAEVELPYHKKPSVFHISENPAFSARDSEDNKSHSAEGMV